MTQEAITNTLKTKDISGKKFNYKKESNGKFRTGSALTKKEKKRKYTQKQR